MPPLKLENFQTADPAGERSAAAEGPDAEEARLAAYEQGYAAGWDDCAAAQSDDQKRLGAELARSLQALSFTYHEARGHVLRAIAPLMLDVTLKLLPEVAREALAPLVLDALVPLAETLADQPATLIINPAARPAVESLLERAAGLAVAIREEPSLGEGQAYLKLGETETRIDLDSAVAQITAAVRGFFALTEEERKHG